MSTPLQTQTEIESEANAHFALAVSEVPVSGPGVESSPLTRSQIRNEVGTGTLGPYISVFEAWAVKRQMGEEFSVYGHIDGYCVRKNTGG